MPPFKDKVGPATARRLGAELARAWPEFPTRRFTSGFTAVLVPLELMARVDATAERLARCLPDRFTDAAEILWRALDSPSFTGWMTLPCGTFVAQRGIDHPEVALPLLAELTPRFSSEGPIRPFIQVHPELTYGYLRRWCTDTDEHVRRLVSEGTRPRLPWAPLLRELVADPSPNVPLLDALVDDPSPYVRRSVANHLNDISKDHPDIALALARRWLSRGEGAAWVVGHGLRTLVKRGDPEALEIVGATAGADIRLVDLFVAPDTVRIGDAVTISFTLSLAATRPAEAIVDYRVHYMGARGAKAPKVFKLTRRRLRPDSPVTITRRHGFEPVSIRRILPGRHIIDIQVNGRILGSIAVDVLERATSELGVT